MTPLNKLKRNLDFYISWKLKKTPLIPELLIFDITHRCNLKCVMCDIYKDIKKKEITTNQVKKIILQSKEWGIPSFVFSGGEALVRKDLLELIKYTQKINYNCGILTNGIIPNSIFDKLKPYLIDNTLSLTISLDGINNETHDSIRGIKGTFNKTTSLFKKLKQLKKQYPNINYTAISVIMNKNLEEFPKLIEYLKSMNVNEIQIQSLIENNLLIKNRKHQHMMWITKNNLNLLDKNIDWLVDFKNKNKGLLKNTKSDLLLIKKYFRKELKNLDMKCFQHYKTLLISNNGEVTTCFNSVGDIHKKSLKEIWHSKESSIGRKMVRECKKPCLLPCFVDFNLVSLNSILEKFIIDISNKNNKKQLAKKAQEEIKKNIKLLKNG